MKAIAALTFLPDGTIRGIYTEAIDLAELGKLSVSRAFMIEFDNHAQRWRVLNQEGKEFFSSPSRGECLEWEQEYFMIKEDLLTCTAG